MTAYSSDWFSSDEYETYLHRIYNMLEIMSDTTDRSTRWEYFKHIIEKTNPNSNFIKYADI